MLNIDLRSDTVTKPSDKMREAIASAEVGDDVWGEDPTVNKLQLMCAELTGKESSLFVPSGTMANQLAVKCHTKPGDEIICERSSHIFIMENAGASFISGVQIMSVEGHKGVMDINDVISHIRPYWYHYPETSLICIENTHNRSGGTIYPLNEIKKVSELARERGIKTHLDGARIFNAIVETGIPLAEYSQYFDSVSFCFSKGLGAPVGSVICGDHTFIEKARRYRKILGGGMRQSGIMAAAAIYALENNIMRLKEDHRNARLFAEAIYDLDYIDIDLTTVQTNIVMFRVKEHPYEFKSYLESKGVLTVSERNIFRAVFHIDVSYDHTLQVIEIFKSYKNGISVKQIQT